MAGPTVFIVDDDPGIRENLPLLFEMANVKVVCFSSADEFLKSNSSTEEGCLLLDVRMPGITGPELQEELARRKVRLPIIFLSAYADVLTSVEAMKMGAVDFLTKPVNGALLLQRVMAALNANRKQLEAEDQCRWFKAKILSLTLRERDVLVRALSGKTNKDISIELSISQRTIESHRARIYLKMGVSSLLQLVQQAADLGITLPKIAEWATAATE